MTIHFPCLHRSIRSIYLSPAMATILMPKVNILENTPKISSSDRHAAEHLANKQEHPCLENKSIFYHYFGRTLISRYNSSNPPTAHESFSSLSESSKQSKDSGVDKVKYSFATMSVMRKSRVGTAVDSTDKEACVKHSANAQNKNTSDSTLASDEKLSSSTVKRFVQEKQQCSLKSSNFSKGTPKPINFHSEVDYNQKINQNSHDLTSNNDAISQKCGETLMIEAKNFHFNSKFYSEENVTGTTTKCLDSSAAPYKEPSMFEITTVGLKLKGKLQSNFLSNDFKLLETFKTDTENVESCETINKIDEILMHYGISNNAQDINNKQGNSDEKDSLINYQTENGNTSQNNETQMLSQKETLEVKKKDDPNSSKFTDIFSWSAASLSRTLNRSFTNQKELSVPSQTNIKNDKLSVDIRANVSRNETLTSDNAENDELRKYGSSVDFTAAVSAEKNLQLAKNNYGRYDYGKASSFSGDIVADTKSTHQSIGSTNYENQDNKASTLNLQTDGSQVDIVKTPDPSLVKDSEYTTYRNGPTTKHSLELTLSNERQRLRRLDNLITATSFRAQGGMPLSKTHVTRFISPQQDFQHYQITNETNRTVSTPTLPSLSYRATLTNRNSWSRSAHSDIPVRLGKSAYDSGFWTPKFPSDHRYGSNPETRTQYTPYQSARTSNKQHNNSTYFALPMDYVFSHKNTNKNYLNVLPNKEKEFPFKNNCKKYNSNSNKEMSQSQFLNPTKYVSSLSIYNNSRNDTCVTKSGYKTTQIIKKGEKSNTNDSKSSSSLFSGLHFSKDTNRIWPETMLTKTLTTKSPHGPLNFSTYKPYIPLYVKKNETFYNLARELFMKKQPQNFISTNLYSRKESLSATSARKQSGHNDTEFISFGQARRRSPEDKYQTSQGNIKKRASSLEKRKAKSGQLLTAYKTDKLT